jgi:membrane carboxypeptidase/penicillin-binding protein
LRPETAFQMTSILSDNKARSPVFGKNSPLAFDDLTVAAKTGTTQEYRDAWTIGYSKDIAVGVWVGNHDNAPLRYGAAGSVVAGPIWRGFIDKYYEQNELIAFEAPNDLEKIRIRTASGYRQEYIAPWQQENYQKPLVRRRPSVVVIP